MGLERAKITIEHTGEEIEVMFNPAEYSVNQDNNFASQAVPGLSSPILQFVHGNLKTLEMELFFDTSIERTDVRRASDKVVGLLAIDSDLHAPPVLRVAWGSLQFRGVLARASQSFTLFLDDGRPVRAKVNVTFNEFIDPEREARQVNRQTADFSKVHVVKEGESLPLLAARFYDNAQMWRPIALDNGLVEPRAELTGEALSIPSLPYVHPETGEVLR